MNIRRLAIGSIALLATAALGSAAVADGIYKWTDADGNVHYEDRPSGSANEERLQLTFKRTDRGGVQNRNKSFQDAQAARREAGAAADDEKRAAEEKKAEEEDRKQKCESYRARLETMIQSRRLYRQDENGERVYLDDTERQEARTQTEDLVQEYCN